MAEKIRKTTKEALQHYFASLPPDQTVVTLSQVARQLKHTRQWATDLRPHIEEIASCYGRRIPTTQESYSVGGSVNGKRKREETDQKVAPFLGTDCSLSEIHAKTGLSESTILASRRRQGDKRKASSQDIARRQKRTREKNNTHIGPKKGFTQSPEHIARRVARRKDTLQRKKQIALEK